jgi:hypothetical protein
MEIELEWIPIIFGESDCPDPPFFLINKDEYVWVGSTVFDFYDGATHWFPFPKMPMAPPVITNDGCISALLKNKENQDGI